jgi:DNA-binding transcriptional LysR family regulator
VHQWAQRILEDVRLMGEAVSQEKQVAEGLIRICSSSGFGRSKLAAALSALAVQQPLLEIQLELLDRAVDLVEEGFQLDIRVGSVREGNVITAALRITGAFCARHRHILQRMACRSRLLNWPAISASASASATRTMAAGH